MVTYLRARRASRRSRPLRSGEVGSLRVRLA